MREGMRTVASDWPIEDAESRLDELIAEARLRGPQAITRHGDRVAVVVSVKEFTRLTDSAKSSLADFLTTAPLWQLDVGRSAIAAI